MDHFYSEIVNLTFFLYKKKKLLRVCLNYWIYVDKNGFKKIEETKKATNFIFVAFLDVLLSMIIEQ